MKKSALAALVLAIVFVFSSCSPNLTDKNSIIGVFSSNKEAIIEAVESGNFYAAEKISGIYEVSVYENYVEFNCGATGIVPSSTYYGFFYSPHNDPSAILGAGYSADDFVPEGDSLIWSEPDGDNEFYVEQIEENFFYYEMKF